jgi:hypothetical protein
VFQIDSESGIQFKGAVQIQDLDESAREPTWSYYWAPHVRRSVLADDVAYAISDAGIRVANVSSLSQAIRTIAFDRPSN